MQPTRLDAQMGAFVSKDLAFPSNANADLVCNKRTRKENEKKLKSLILGWDGFLCDTEIDECMSAPCLNGAVCIDLLADYACACLFGKRKM